MILNFTTQVVSDQITVARGDSRLILLKPAVTDEIGPPSIPGFQPAPPLSSISIDFKDTGEFDHLAYGTVVEIIVKVKE